MANDANKERSILIVGNFPPPFGGVPRVLEYLVASLRQAGWSVAILSHAGVAGVDVVNGATVYRFSLRARLCGALKRCWQLKLLFTPEARSFLKADFKSFVSYLGYMDGAVRIARRHNCQLIYAVNLTYGIPPAVLAARHLNLPLVASIYGEVYTHTAFLKRHIDWVGAMFRQPQHMLAMTRHCATSPRLIGIDRALGVLVHGVDLDTFSPGVPRDSFWQRHALPTNSAICLFVGRQTSEMGLDKFMSIIEGLWQKQLPVHALIVGAQGNLSGAAQAFLARHPKRVTVLTNIPYDDLADCYRAATIAILPTSGERACGSLAAVEAMGCGRPVLASRVGGIPEVVEDQATGILIEPANTPGFVEAAERLLADPSLAVRLGVHGRSVALARLEQGNAAAAYVSLFDEVRTRIPRPNSGDTGN